MPQIDKVTFALISYWILTFYVVQFLVLNVTHLYRFLNTFKIKLYRLLLLRLKIQLYVRYIMIISNSSWLKFRSIK